MSIKLSICPLLAAARMATASAGVLACLAGTALAEAGALEGAMTASVVTLNEAGEEVVRPADTIVPGGIIEYAMSYRNTSDDVLSAITIDGPIPNNTAYVAGSQSVSEAAVFEAQAPGVDWSVPPLLREEIAEDGTRRTVEVPEGEYTQIRWRVAEALQPGGSVSFVYRVQVDE